MGFRSSMDALEKEKCFAPDGNHVMISQLSNVWPGNCTNYPIRAPIIF